MTGHFHYAELMEGMTDNQGRHADDFQIYDTLQNSKEANNLSGQPGVPTQQAFKDRVLQVRRSASDAQRPYDNDPVPSVAVSGADFGYEAGAVASSGAMPLRAGKHPVRIYYNPAGAERALNLSWSSQSISSEPIPSSAFYAVDVAGQGQHGRSAQ